MLATETGIQVPGQRAPVEIADLAVNAGHSPIDLESLRAALER